MIECPECGSTDNITCDDQECHCEDCGAIWVEE